MNNTVSGIISVLTAIVGVAVIAVLVAPRAQTAGVVTATGQAFAGALNAATAPVSGGFQMQIGSTRIGSAGAW